ncbi:MAG: pilin [Patescibacteria group bacterium]
MRVRKTWSVLIVAACFSLCLSIFGVGQALAAETCASAVTKKFENVGYSITSGCIKGGCAEWMKTNPGKAEIVTNGTCPNQGEECCALHTDPQDPLAKADQSPAASLGASEYPNPLGQGVKIFDVMGRVVKAFLGVIGAVSLLIFIYGGITYMTAGGEESRVTKARDVLKYATIGLVAIVLAYAAVNFFISALTGT